MKFAVTRKRLLLALLVGVLGIAGFAGYALWFGPGAQITEANAKKIVRLTVEQVVDILGLPGDYSIFLTNPSHSLYFRFNGADRISRET
jgi:hypothetical protein